MKTGNTLFESGTEFKYVGTVITNPDDIHEEIKSRRCLEMPASVQCRIVCFSETWGLKYTELYLACCFILV
jgi:hypothetical protein